MRGEGKKRVWRCETRRSRCTPRALTSQGREGAHATARKAAGGTVERTHSVFSKARQSWLSLRARLPLTASAHQRTAELTSVERLVSVKTLKKCHKLQNFESEDPLQKILIQRDSSKISFLSETSVKKRTTGAALQNSTQFSVAVYFGNGVSRHKTYPKPFCLTSSPIGTVQATAGSQSYNEKL